MTVSDRSYLSIGEVLTLLQGEFPDVTISKIRFLESQGLIDPERTPSGYRKFYAADIDRLRFILHEQRAHYLPLKVIRDRLGDDAAPAVRDAAADVDPVTPSADVHLKNEAHVFGQADQVQIGEFPGQYSGLLNRNFTRRPVQIACPGMVGNALHVDRFAVKNHRIEGSHIDSFRGLDMAYR